jgi:hypothetical protein
LYQASLGALTGTALSETSPDDTKQRQDLCARDDIGRTTVIGKNSVVRCVVLLAKSLPENSAVTAERSSVVKTLQIRPLENAA